MQKLKYLILCLLVAGACSTAHAEQNWGKMLIESFEFLGSDLSQIEHKTKEYHADSWYRTSVIDVTTIGAGACAIPVTGMVTLPAEFVYLMREIYNSSMGLGFLINDHASKDDFAVILGIWAGEITVEASMLHNLYSVAETTGVNEKLASTVGASGVVSKYTMSQLIAQKTGAKVAGKLATKIAAKAGAKISAKYAAKVALSWIPFVSAAACAGLNAWIMNGVLSSAEDFYQQRAKVRQERM